MNRPKLFKALRITWSATCIVVAVLLCVLWARSYQHYEAIAQNNGKGWTTILCSTGGTMHFVSDFMMNYNVGYVLPGHRGEWVLTQTEVKYPVTIFEWKGSLLGESKIIAPHWLLVTLLAVVAALPWIRHFPHRFSIRTLLIATTLIAVVDMVIIVGAMA